MRKFRNLVTIIAVVISPLTILGCGVKGDPMVPSAEVTSP